MSQYTEHVAARVRAKAAERRITQRQISEVTGIAPSTLARRMAGVNPWNTDQLAAIAEVLACDPAELLGASKPAPLTDGEVAA